MVPAPEPSAFDASIAALTARAFCRAVEGEDFEDVCRLRYAAYKREGALPEGAPRRFADAFDETDNGTTFGFYVDGALAASIRIHVASASAPDCPASQVFSDHIDGWFDAGDVVIDPTRFVIDHEASRLWPRLPYVVVKTAWMAACWHGSRRLLATVRTEHQAFYRRTFGHRIVAPARAYPSLAKPISLMVADPLADRARVEARYPYLAFAEPEAGALFDAVAQAHTNLGYATHRLSSLASSMRAASKAARSVPAG